MNLTIIIEPIFIMSIILGIGSFLSKFVSFQEEARSILMAIIVNIAMPCFVLSSILNVPIHDAIFRQVGLIFLISLCCNLFGLSIGWLVCRFIRQSRDHIREVAVLSGLGNTGLIGIPLCGALYGAKGALFAAVFDAGVNISVWTVGILTLQRQRFVFSIQRLKTMVNMPMIAILVGLSLRFFHFHPPTILMHLLERLANVASPLAMIFIGLMIPKLWVNRKEVNWIDLVTPICTKLIIFPLGITLILIALHHLFVFDLLMVKVILIQCTMPIAMITSILFARANANDGLAAIATVLSTLLSMVTIPIMVTFIESVI